MRAGLATRLYRGEAGINVVGRRRVWFSVAGVVLLVAILSFTLRGFTTGIEFRGGNEFQIPASVGSMASVEDEVGQALAQAIEKTGTDSSARVVSVQRLGGSAPTYLVRTSPLDPDVATEVKQTLATTYRIDPSQISDNQVSAAWGKQVTQQALLGLAIFLALVIAYLIVRFEWRMAVASVSSLLLDLLLTAAVYSLVGFEVTPSTIIGFLTILGFALYDVVVVFDKVQENTRGITASGTQTYAEAANLALNQTLMRSINTGLVALLPVGGLLFIGAGLLRAGTLKDLGLVLFIGMGAAVYSSIFFATPVLVWLKEQEPRIKLHTQRVLSRRAAGRDESRAKAPKQPAAVAAGAPAAGAAASVADSPDLEVADEPAGVGASRAPAATGAPRPGARPGGKRSGRGGPRGGRSGGKRR